MGYVLSGMNPDDKPNEKKKRLPVAWIKSYTGESGKTDRIFTTTMGHAGDLKDENFPRLLVNTCYWSMGLEDKIPAQGDVTILGEQYRLRRLQNGPQARRPSAEPVIAAIEEFNLLMGEDFSVQRELRRTQKFCQ